MRDFEQKLLLTTALVSSICFTAARAADEPVQGAPAPGASAGTAGDASTKNAETSTVKKLSDIAPPSNTSTITPNMFTPGIRNFTDMVSNDDEDKPDMFKAESPEAIKKANELHASAMTALKADKIEEAIRLDEQASKAAPHYWLPHAALSYLYSNFRGGGPALEEATWAIKCEHPVMADNNHAVLISHMRAFVSGQTFFKKVLQEDPTSWRAKVGLAQLDVADNKPDEARKLLEELSSEDPKDPSELLLIGYNYKRLNEPEKAKELIKQALNNSSNDPKLQEKVLLTLFQIALDTNDKALLAELKPKVLKKVDARQRAWLRIANIVLADNVQDAKLALQMAETETVSDIEFREYAKIFGEHAKSNTAERAAWLALQKDALQHAFDFRQSMDNKVLLAAVMDDLGDRAGAVKLLKTATDYTQTEHDQDIYVKDYYKKMRQAEDAALASLVVQSGNDYKVAANQVTFKIPMANCRCKTNSARSVIKGLPGVLDVVVGPGDVPVATVFFNPKKTSKEAIFNSDKVKNFHQKLEIGEPKPVASLSEMGSVYSNQERAELAAAPNVSNVALQFPTLEDAQIKVTAESKPAI